MSFAPCSVIRSANERTYMTTAKRVLIMDDDPDHLLVCSLVFERRGVNALCLRGCAVEEFVEIVSEFSPDIIFLDHRMRGITGSLAVRQLRSDRQYASIPVVYLSEDRNVAWLAAHAGADAYLRKPFGVHRLIQVTNRLVSELPAVSCGTNGEATPSKGSAPQGRYRSAASSYGSIPATRVPTQAHLGYH